MQNAANSLLGLGRGASAIEGTYSPADISGMRPLTLCGLGAADRRQVIVTTVVDDRGVEHVVSRMGDTSWDLSALWATQNDQPSQRVLKWPIDLPEDLLADAKAAFYVWLRRGRDNTKAPNGRSLRTMAVSGLVTLRALAARGVRRFADVHAIHLSDMVAELRSSSSPTTIRMRLVVLDLAWVFKADLLFPMMSDPWRGRSLGAVCGIDDGEEHLAGKRARTPVIPPSVQAKLFRYALACVDDAPAAMAMRDAGRLSAEGPRLKRLRDAVLYLLQITSGMRNSEATAVKNNAWRVEVRDGIEFNWVTTTEFKTGKGRVDYLVPPQTVAALAVLQRYAQPLQERLRQEIARLEIEVGSLESAAGRGNARRISLLQRLDRARASVDNLFLGRTLYAHDGSGQHSRIEVMSNHACGTAMERLAQAAEVSWPLTNHQCRRTFAWTVANSRLGRSGLLFVKWQLKHSSISMAQLYAANPHQDAALYEEFYEELVQAQSQVLESWFETDQPLAGGAGRKIVRTRAIAIEDRERLLKHTAETVTLRSTGHSWCLAEQSGCVGEGIYEAIRCGSCSAGVIDSSQAQTWQEIHSHNLQLAEVTDCGPAVRQRALRDIAASEAVLRDLGVPLPTTPASALDAS